MSSSDFFTSTDPRLRNFIRQYSDYFRQNNLEPPVLSQSTHPAQQMYNLNPANDMFLNEQFRRGSDVRSLIQQLMTKKEMKVQPQQQAMGYSPASRPVLVNAEQRIFQEVVNLLMQINEIKEAIQKEKDLTLQMEVERDSLLNKGSARGKSKKLNDFEMESIINKLKSKEGDELRISMAQLEKFSTENEYLEKNINRLKLKSKGNLRQVLQQQKSRYRALKQKLQQKNSLRYEPQPIPSTNPDIAQQIQRLQSDIERLEVGVEDGSNLDYEIKRLNQQNQRLKQKTISLMKESRHGQTPQQAQQRRNLQQYIRQQQQSKMLFFQDLKKFKQEYEQLRNQNEELKRRLKGSYAGSQAGSRAEMPPLPPRNSGSNAGSNKFMKYQDLMSEMNIVMK